MAHESAYALRIQHVHGLSDTDGVLLSPINIELDSIINIDLPDLTWYNYDQPAKKMKVTNTSHTAIVSAKWLQERPFINSGPLLSSYVFSQLHFHWGNNNEEGSEHTVEEKRFPMEMHVVHFKSSYLTQERALREKDGLVVLVYFFKVQEKRSGSMQSIINVIPQVQNAHTSAHITPRPISDFVRPFAKNYFMYWGSVMTSSCSHRILWLVSREPIGISSDQMESFRMLKDSSNTPIKHHRRSVQPLHGRSLFLVNGIPHLDEVLLPIPSKPSSVISVLGPGYTKTIGDVPVEPENEIPQESEPEQQEKENNIPFQQISAFYAPNTVVIGNPLQRSYTKMSQVPSFVYPTQHQTYLYENSLITEEPWTLSSDTTIVQPSAISVNTSYTSHNPCQFSETSSECSKYLSLHSNIASVRTQTSDDELLDDFTRYSRRREDVSTQVPSEPDIHRKPSRSKRKCMTRRSEHRGLHQRSRYISRAVCAPSVIGSSYKLQRTPSKKPLSTEFYVWPYKYIRSCANLQIPVNIIPRQVPGKRFPPLDIGNLVSYNGYATIANTGNSVEIKLHGRPLPLLQGGPVDDIYVFNHVHFHWNEEEYSNTELLLDGYSVEAHAIYCKQGYKFVEEACERKDGLVIVAAFLQECELYNREFEKVSGKLSNIRQPNTNTELVPDALSWMAKLGPSGYFTYSSSRRNKSTSSITWILYPEPISISHSQVEAFHKLYTSETDTGFAIEKLADHPIYYSI